MRFAAVILLCAGCSAQQLDDALGAQAELVELDHDVSMYFSAGEARLQVTRHFRNDTDGSRSFAHAIALPDDGVATSFAVEIDGAWQPTAFLDATVAGDSWAELTGVGHGAARTLAMLSGPDHNSVTLDVFALAPRATLGVRYDVRAPAVATDGHWSVEYPTDTEQALIPIQPHLPTVTTALVAGCADLDARFGTFSLGTARTAWALQVDTALKLSQPPVRASVVFVVDASHSQGVAGIAAQLELIPGYLAAVPDAQVEVVLYRRQAERLFGRFEPAEQVAALLRAVPAERLLPGNGSHLDRGAALAASLLAPYSTARVVLFTDDEWRDALDEPAFSAALQSLSADTVVHLVSRRVGKYALSEARNDEHPFAAAIGAHGGIALSIDGHDDDPAVVASTMLGLVRPIRIDGFSIDAPSLQMVDLEVPAVLHEGEPVRLLALTESTLREVKVSGKVWARSIDRTLPLDPELSARVPALALGDAPLSSALEAQEVRAAAMAIGAVSRETSYLFAPPDAAPSAEFDDTLGAGSFDCGGIGGSSSCSIGCSMGVGEPRPDLMPVLRGLLADAAARCGSSASVITIEATGDEVVEVGATGPARDCLVEAGWQLRLTPAFIGHHSYRVTLAANER